MTNSNGHSSPQVIAANRVVEAAHKRLQAAKAKLAELQQAEAEKAAAQQRLDSATDEREAQAAHAKLVVASNKAKQAAVPIKEQQRLLAQAEQEYTQADAALQAAIDDEDIARLERSVATSKHRLDQLQSAITLEEQEYNKLASDLRTRTRKRDGARVAAANQLALQQKQQRDAPNAHGHLVTRQGF